jgi:hypothetical protein
MDGQGLGERGVRIALEGRIAEIGNSRLKPVQLDDVGAFDPADIGARAALEHGQNCRQPVDGADVHIKGFGRLLADGRVRARGIDLLGPADREEQSIGLLAGLSIGREQRLDIALESERQLAEGRPTIKARKCEIDRKILWPLGGDVRPSLGARRALDQAKSPLEATKGTDNSRSFGKLVDVGQAPSQGKEVHQRLEDRFVILEPVDRSG